MKEFFDKYYFLIIVLSIATILSFLWLVIFNRERLKAKWWELLIVSILHTLIGVGAVKLFAILENGGDFSFKGMSLFGGLFFMPLVYFIYAKIKKLPVLEVFDVFVFSLAITYACSRFNCLHDGCCYGKFIDSTNTMRYPTRELEIVFHSLSAIGAAIFVIKNMCKENVFFIYLGGYGVFRFIIEFMRHSDSNSVFHIAHLWSTLSVIVVITILIIRAYLAKSKKAK